MNYYEIIPLTRISLNHSPSFTYSSKEVFKFGDLVEIDFAGKKLKGVVDSKTKRPFYKTKLILKLLQEEAINKKQLKIAEKISKYYLTGLGIVLKFFIVKSTKKLTPPSAPESDIGDNKKEKVILTPSQKKITNEIKLSKKIRKFLVAGPASSGKTEIAMNCIGSALKQKKQCLVIIPEIFLSYQEIDRYFKRFKNHKVALFHSGLTATQKNFIKKGVQDGTLNLIISTKIGCLLPFKNLGFIVVDEEQDISHKQWDQSPRYHVRQVSSWLQKIHNTNLIYLSATPSMEILEEAQGKSMKHLKLPMLSLKKIEVNQPSFEFVNLKQYFYKKKANVIISNELKIGLKNSLDTKKTAFILVQRRGRGKALMCLDCKTKVSCPKCNLPLVQVGEKYQCLHCDFKISSLSQCPKCRSFRIVNLGFGTESAYEKIKTIFPKARIEIIDQTALTKKNTRRKLYEKLKNQKIDILIGTQSIIKGFDLPNVSLTAILNTESWSGKTDFKFDERWLGSLFQIAGRVNRPGSLQKGKFLVQTFNPENYLFDYLKKWKWEDFAKNELKSRKAIKYPPFYRFIKLIYRDSDKIKVDKNIKKVYNQLQKVSAKEIISILPPFYGNIEKARGSYQKFILVKTKPVKKYSPILQKIFNKLGENWYFDVDPENVF